jgi:hypothetical protein
MFTYRIFYKLLEKVQQKALVNFFYVVNVHGKPLTMISVMQKQKADQERCLPSLLPGRQRGLPRGQTISGLCHLKYLAKRRLPRGQTTGGLCPLYYLAKRRLPRGQTTGGLCPLYYLAKRRLSRRRIASSLCPL